MDGHVQKHNVQLEFLRNQDDYIITIAYYLGFD